MPTLVETHKTIDSIAYYKVSDVGQILEVSSVKDIPGNSRPKFDDISNEALHTEPTKPRSSDDYTIPSGLLNTTVNIKEAMKEDQIKVDPIDIKEMDTLYAELDSDVTRREKSTEEAHKPFIYEELVDEEPYMEYWDERTEIEQGKDNFLSSARKAYDVAYERYSKKAKENNES